jgi:glycosyltransferase involved in cell wall biosynthesis
MAVLPLVSVLIPTRNNADELLLCLESLRNLKYPKDRMEILVFDNGSTDGTSEQVQELFAQFRLEGWARLALEGSPRNLGAFGGRAEALQRALGPKANFILSLDDDVELEPDAINLLLDVMNDPRVGIVGARVVYHDAPDEVASGPGYLNRWFGTFHHLQKEIYSIRFQLHIIIKAYSIVGLAPFITSRHLRGPAVISSPPVGA